MLSALWTVLLIWIAQVNANDAGKLNVYHRLLIPGSSDAPWIRRGRFELEQWMPSPGFTRDLKRLTGEPKARDARSLYQVALERPGDTSSEDWEIVSVKSVSLLWDARKSLMTGEKCYLQASPNEEFTLHVSNRTVYGMSYSIDPVKSDGGCVDSPPPLLEISTIVRASSPRKPAV